MTVINPNLPANLFVQSTTQPVNHSELNQLDLRLDQVVRATVVEGGLDKAILELNHQYYRAQTEKELQVGQQLKLQVSQLQPRLEFRVLNDSLNNRLAQLLPLLTRPYDWGKLLSRLQQVPDQSGQVRTLPQVYSQLQQLLAPAGEHVSVINDSVIKIFELLGQLTSLPNDPVVNNNAPMQPPSSLKSAESSMPLEIKASAAAAVDRSLVDLIQELKSQVSLLPRYTDKPMSQDWLAQTRSILVLIQQKDDVIVPLPSAQREVLFDVLKQLQAHRQVPVHLKTEVAKTLLQLEKQVIRNLVPSTHQLAPEVEAETLIEGDPLARGALTTLKESSAVSVASPAKEGTPPEKLAMEVRTLMKLLQQPVVQKSGLPPELIGRLEGLLSRFQQLPFNVSTGSVMIPGLDMLLSQFAQAVSLPSYFPQGGQLGLLSQLFGFYLETELLQGKAKEALASLKLGLLTLQQQSAEDVAEPLKRLELYQCCKSRLGEDQVQFLPLPFAELEEGYLLAERHEQPTEGREGQAAINLSLSLRLSALGNVRIDMLYDQQGLQLRIAGENQEKRDFFQSYVKELRDSIHTVKLHGINFAADAQLPAKQLQQRLLPESLNMLDTRI